jgi:hypothetical protein
MSLQLRVPVIKQRAPTPHLKHLSQEKASEKPSPPCSTKFVVQIIFNNLGR